MKITAKTQNGFAKGEAVVARLREKAKDFLSLFSEAEYDEHLGHIFVGSKTSISNGEITLPMVIKINRMKVVSYPSYSKEGETTLYGLEMIASVQMDDNTEKTTTATVFFKLYGLMSPEFNIVCW